MAERKVHRGPAKADLTVSKGEYARLRGCTPTAVSRALREGRITADKAGRIDPAAANEQWAQNSRARGDSAPAQIAAAPSQPPDEPAPPAPEVTVTYADARARRERAAAEREELELAKAAGRLIDREMATKAVFEAFRGLRDRVMAVPRRCAGAVVGLDVRETEAAIAEELRKAMGPDEAQFLAVLPWKVTSS